MVNQFASRRTLLSLSLVCGVPILVLGYFAVIASEALIREMEFWYTDPALISVWGSSLVHHSNAHLINNILAYLAVIVPAYLVFDLRKQLRAFFWTLFGFITTVPPIVRLLDWWILAEYLELVAPVATARGFSGIVSAVAGLLFVASLSTIRDRHGDYWASRVVFIITCSLVGYIALVKPAVPKGIFIVMLVGSISYIYHCVQQIEEPTSSIASSTADLIPAIAAIVATLFLMAIVPIEFIKDGTYTGVIAHSTGFLSGSILTAVSIRYL